MLIALPIILQAITVHSLSIPSDRLQQFFQKTNIAMVHTDNSISSTTPISVSPSPSTTAYQYNAASNPNPQFVHRLSTPFPRPSIAVRRSTTPTASEKPSNNPSVSPSTKPSLTSTPKPSIQPMTTPKSSITPTPKSSVKATLKPTATPTPKPQTPVPLAASDIAQMEQKVLELTNQERSKNGLSPLSGDAKIAEVARKHSQDMVSRHFFSHTNPDGITFDKRLSNAGIPYQAAAENIAMNHSAEAAVSAWMNSSGHRANILSTKYHKLGVGIAKGSDGYYFTQDFTN